MSVEAITWALGAETESATDKAVLLVVANYADEWGRCWPALQTIAAQARCSRSTAQRALKRMEEMGFLSRTDRRRKDGSFTSDELALHLQNKPGVKLTSGQSDRRSNTESPGVNLTPLTTFEPTTTFEGSLRSPSNGTVRVARAAKPPASKPSKAKTDRGSRLPENWAPRQAEADMAAAAGFSPAEITACADGMRDWAASATGSNARKHDWDAAFRNWLRRAIGDAAKGRRPVTARPARVYSEADLQAARVKAATEHGAWNPKWGEPPAEVLPFLKAQGART
jgi:AraC-like DNA-binding protein